MRIPRQILAIGAAVILAGCAGGPNVRTNVDAAADFGALERRRARMARLAKARRMLPKMPIGDLLQQASPEVAFCDQRAKGYILLTLTREKATGDYIAMSTIYAPKAEARTLKRVSLPAGATRFDAT